MGDGGGHGGKETKSILGPDATDGPDSEVAGSAAPMNFGLRARGL